jgi:hypothetical protein
MWPDISKINGYDPKIRLEKALYRAYLLYCAKQHLCLKGHFFGETVMDIKLTDQMEREWMEQEFLSPAMDRLDAGVLLGTCLLIAIFVGVVLATAG